MYVANDAMETEISFFFFLKMRLKPMATRPLATDDLRRRRWLLQDLQDGREISRRWLE